MRDYLHRRDSPWRSFYPWQPRAVRRSNPASPTRIAALSEPAGYFDTDNLISNERSYLHVAPALRELARRAAGGVYLGVGPDQNFSYIAHARPLSRFSLTSVAITCFYICCLRRFSRKRDRAWSTWRCSPAASRRAPDTDWSQQPVDALVTYIDGAPRLSDARVTALRGRMTAVIRGFGVAMSDADRSTIDRFHRPLHRGRPWPPVQQHRSSATVRLSDLSRLCCWRSIVRARGRTSWRPNPTSSL